MRNLLVALTGGYLAGEVFALYRTMKQQRIRALERELEELRGGSLISPALHSPELPTVRGGVFRN